MKPAIVQFETSHELTFRAKRCFYVTLGFTVNIRRLTSIVVDPRCATVREMKEGPSRAAIRCCSQVLLSSHRELLSSKAMVVNVADSEGRPIPPPTNSHTASGTESRSNPPRRDLARLSPVEKDRAGVGLEIEEACFDEPPTGRADIMQRVPAREDRSASASDRRAA
jgi:hypothetical protein